jgi:cytidyltransferase-like protein
MSKSSPIIAVTGAFDDMKSRDLRFLEEAARLGEVTALVWSDDVTLKRRGRLPKFPQAERLYFLQAIRFVSRVRLVSRPFDEDALPGISGFKPDVWAVNESLDRAKKKEFCKTRGLKYRVIPDRKLAGFPAPRSKSVRSPRGRKKVIVTGCYDWFHSGHVRFFEEAASYGDLYVVVGHDENIRLLKGEGRPLFPAEERRYVVGSIRLVKAALISTGKGWMDAEPEIQKIRPEIYVVNEDGDVPEKRAYCGSHGLEYIVLKRTPAPGLPKRTSTDLRGY